MEPRAPCTLLELPASRATSRSWISEECAFPSCLSLLLVLHPLLILALCLGRSYDEKVDVFSFGIVLCEVGHISSPCAQTQWLLPTLQSSHAPAWMSTGTSDPENLAPQSQSTTSVGYSLVPGHFYLKCHQHFCQAQGSHTKQGLCTEQIIGRVNADPDYLPRTMDFGLNVRGFLDRYCPPNCPPSFFPITVRCCDLDPEKR